MLRRVIHLSRLLFPSPAARRQFVRFAVVGATNTVLDFGVYLALTRGVPLFAERYVLAATASFLVAVTSSYLLNTFWTFRADLSVWHVRMPKFFLVAALGLAINAAILAIVVRLGVHDVATKLLATGIVTVWNFTLQRNWTFGGRD